MKNSYTQMCVLFCYTKLKLLLLSNTINIE